MLKRKCGYVFIACCAVLVSMSGLHAEAILRGRVIPVPGESMPESLQVVLRVRGSMGTHASAETYVEIGGDSGSAEIESIPIAVDADGNFEFRFAGYLSSGNVESQRHPYDVLVSADGYPTQRIMLPADEWWLRGEQQFVTVQLRKGRPKVDPDVPSKARKEMEAAAKSTQKNELDKALEHLEKAVAAYPKYSEAYNNMGVIHLKMGNRDAAEKDFSRAVDADPESAAAQKNLGFIFLTSKREKEALDPLKKAAELDPQPSTLAFLGEALYQNGQFTEAVVPLKQALEADPSFFRASYRLGYVYLEMKEYPLALEAFQQFLKTNQGMDASSVQGIVQQLESALSEAR